MRTCTPGSAFIASVALAAWSSLSAFRLMSTTIRSECDSTTSKAVITPPIRPTAVVRSPAAPDEGGASKRTVMEYPGPGTGIVAVRYRLIFVSGWT